MTKPPKDSPAGLLHTALSGSGSVDERVIAISRLRERLLYEEDQMAFTMRLHHCTWQEIADAFGISRQAAHQRFANSAALLDKLAEARA